MTIAELIDALKKYPQDLKVVIDTSCDYEDYDEVDRVVPGKYDRFRVGEFKPDDRKPNAVRLK